MPRLLKVNVITMATKKAILAGRTRHERAERLLDAVQEKGSIGFRYLLETLGGEGGYPQLFSVLSKEGMLFWFIADVAISTLIPYTSVQNYARHGGIGEV